MGRHKLRRQARERAAWLVLLSAAARAVFTLVRGELIDFYPYPFVDLQYGLTEGGPEHRGVVALFYALTRGPWRSTGASARVSTSGVN